MNKNIMSFAVIAMLFSCGQDCFGMKRKRNIDYDRGQKKRKVQKKAQIIKITPENINNQYKKNISPVILNFLYYPHLDENDFLKVLSCFPNCVGLHIAENKNHIKSETLKKTFSKTLNPDFFEELFIGKNCNICPVIIQKFLGKCHNLTSLHLQDDIYITDKTLCVVADNCPSLRDLHLRNCKHLGESAPKRNGLKEILVKCTKLEHLTIIHGENLETSTFMLNEKVKSLPNLKTIHLKHCTFLTDGKIRKFITRCPNVTSLAIIDSPCISDITDAITSTMKNLNHLDISYSSIGGDKLKTILSKCKKIKTLLITGCKNITQETLLEIWWEYKGIDKTIHGDWLFYTEYDKSGTPRKVWNPN